MVNPENLPIISTTILQEKIPSFDWTGGHAGVILNSHEAQVLEDIFNLYLKDNSQIFLDRFDLIKRRNTHVKYFCKPIEFCHFFISQWFIKT
jgi:hypothetical protein